MNFYREAAASLRQNRGTVLLFIAAGMAIAVISSSIDLFILAPVAKDAPDQYMSLVLIVSSIVLVAMSSVANTICFSRIGREMDKPMWRIADDREAMRLFYRLWFLLGLLTLVYLFLFGALVPTNADQGTLILFRCTLAIWATLLNVFGSFVMFYGRAGREEVTQAFRTLGHQLGPVVAVCLLGLLAGWVLGRAHDRTAAMSLATGTDFAARYLVEILIGAVDSLVGCFIFAYSWLVCIYHRDHFEEPGDDFDF